MKRALLTYFAVILLTGCVNLPDTKALITPIGAVGVHSFAPRHTTPRSIDVATPDAQKIAANAKQGQDSSVQ